MKYNQVLRKVKPSKKDSEESKKFSRVLMKEAEFIGKKFAAKPMLCGSVAKNTWLNDKNDLDLFFLFSPLVSTEKLKKYGLDIGKEIIKKFRGKYRLAYSQHPYITGEIIYNNKEYNLDIVPCFNVKSPASIKSAVDRTPYHVKYIKKNLKFPDEVRLLKQFCHAQNVYGADVKTQGFSGYLCELLIINYGTFDRTIKEAIKWRAGKIIDLKYKPKKKFEDPLVLIDPVDPNRNVASPISTETFYKFVDAAKKFVDKPSDKSFFEQTIKPYPANKILNTMKKRGTRWYAIEFNRPKITDDTLYPQMRRTVKTIERIVNENGFKLMRKDFYCNDSKCKIILETEIWEIPKIYKHIGPHVLSKHADEFLKHYKEKNIFIENENWILENMREHTLITTLLKKVFTLSSINLKKIGFPKNISATAKTTKIYTDKQFTKLMSEDFKIFMTQWFNKDIDIV